MYRILHQISVATEHAAVAATRMHKSLSYIWSSPGPSMLPRQTHEGNFPLTGEQADEGARRLAYPSSGLIGGLFDSRWHFGD